MYLDSVREDKDSAKNKVGHSRNDLRKICATLEPVGMNQHDEILKKSTGGLLLVRADHLKIKSSNASNNICKPVTHRTYFLKDPIRAMILC